MYKTRAFASEAPYSDSFVVDTRWVFEQIEANTVRIRVFVDIIFIKSCWVKCMFPFIKQIPLRVTPPLQHRPNKNRIQSNILFMSVTIVLEHIRP